MAEKMESIQQRIVSILEDRRSPDGSLPADALAELRLLGTSQTSIASPDQEGDTYNNLEPGNLFWRTTPVTIMGSRQKMGPTTILGSGAKMVPLTWVMPPRSTRRRGRGDRRRRVPPVSPVMVARVRKLEAHVPNRDAPEGAQLQQEDAGNIRI